MRLITFLQNNPSDPASSLVVMCIMGVFVLMLILMLAAAIRIVPEHKRILIFRMGRFAGERGPGLLFLLPFVDRGVEVDLREQTLPVESRATSRDNARLHAQALIGYKVVDPQKSVLQVNNLKDSLNQLAEATLNSLLSSTDMGEILYDRETIRQRYQNRLEEIVKDWGVEITRVEIRDVRKE